MPYATEPAYAFDKVAGEGGAWITQTGAIYHIKEYAHHGDCEEHLLGGGVAYDLGWVRVSWNQSSEAGNEKNQFSVTFEPANVTVSALHQLRRIMRIIASSGAELYFIETHAASNYETLAKTYSSAYALISKLITEKLACQRKRTYAAGNVNSGTK